MRFQLSLPRGRMAHSWAAAALAGSAGLGCVLAAGAQTPEPRVVHGQPAWILRNGSVELSVTRRGGHMAPVTFYRNTREPVQPYYVSPWQAEKLQLDEPVLIPLRGDFFCLPFGGNQEAVGAEKHPVHGEVAGAEWTYAGQQRRRDITSLTLTLDTRIRKGRVTKQLFLVDGENVLYSRHRIEGFAGPTPLGHHATLALPEKEGSMRIATSAIQFGMTAPGVFSDPAKREYQSFQAGRRFQDLRRVPLAAKGAPDADVTRLPARIGFCDLLLLASQPPAKLGASAWVAAVVPDQRYLWFSLRDPEVLPSTVFWIENHGRHGSPWNGRNRCLGLEDVCAYFADGLAASTRPNVLNRAGVRTAVELSGERPTAVNYIQGAARIPADFDAVSRAEFAPGSVTFISPHGARVQVPVRHEFLRSGSL